MADNFVVGSVAQSGFPDEGENITVPDERTMMDFIDESPIIAAFSDPEKQKNIIRGLEEEIIDMQHRRKDLEHRLSRYYAMWRGTVEEKHEPWHGSSNVAIRMVYDDTQRVHGKYADTFFGQESFMHIRGEEEGDVDAAEQLDQFVEYKMRDVIKAKLPLSEATFQAVRDGTSFVKLFWKTDIRRVREVIHEKETEVIVDPQTGQPFKNPDTGEILLDENGEIPTQETGRILNKTVERDVVKYDDPVIEPIPNLLDVIWPVDATDPQTARWIIHRKILSLDELRQRVLDGIYDQDAVERLNEADIETSEEAADPDNEMGDWQERVLAAAGIDNDQEQEKLFQKQVTIFECYKAHELEDGGMEEEVMLTWVAGKPWFLRAQLNENFGGFRPIFRLRHNRVNGEMLGIGVAELLFDYNDITNTTFNMTIDNIHLGMLGMLRVSEQAQAQNQDMEMFPGRVLTGDRDDIEKIQLGGANPQAFQALSTIEDLAAKLTGISNLSRGQPEENRPVARVTAIRSTQLASFFRVQTEFFGEELGLIYLAIVQLYQQHGDEEFVFQITDPENPGEINFGTILREDVQFTPNINVKAIDIEKAILRENRLNLFPLLMQMSQIPFAQQTLFSGINLREALKQVMKDFEWEGREKVLMRDEDVEKLQLQQQQEIVRAQADAATNAVSQGMDEVAGQFNTGLEQLQQLVASQRGGQ